jgi:hypothetical protein
VIRFIHLCMEAITSPGAVDFIGNSVAKKRHVGNKKPTKSCVVAKFPADCLSDGNGSKLASGWCTDTTQMPRFLRKGEVISLPGNGTSTGKAYRSHDGYLQCLSGKHVVFMGDSRVRYQYIMLVHFLRSGEWMRCRDFGSNHTPSPNCMLIDHEHPPVQHSSWFDWFNSSSAMLQDVCDCSRQLVWDPIAVKENRFFRMETPFGLIKISYLLNFVGAVTIQSEFPPFTPYLSYEESRLRYPSRCQPGYCPNSQPGNIVFNTSEALLRVVPMLEPTHVFASPGWGHDASNIAYEFGCTMETFRRQNPTVQASAISLPCFRGQSANFEVPSHGCNATVFDRRELTANVPQQWYFDRLHVLSIVNQEFNHRLIDVICGPLDSTSTIQCA